MELINKTKEKISSFFKKNAKLLLFLVVFSIVVFIYNQNFQTLNYTLKRGTILEYSYKNENIDIKDIEKQLLSYKIKYSSINTQNKEEYVTYDSDKEKIENSLYVTLPYLIKENKNKLFNKINDYILEKYPNIKLVDVKALNDTYSSPYSAFLKFLGVLFVSLFLWAIILYLICDNKKLNKETKENLSNFIKKQKENTITLFKKTKEKGIGYFLRKIFFDESIQEEKQTSATRDIINTIVFVLVCVIAIRYFIGELRWIPSGSMRPTIMEHDRVFVEKLEYPHKEKKREDNLVFYPPEENLSNSPWAIFTRLSGIMCKDVAFIKRVVGMPKDKFEIKYDDYTNEYRVYINDVALNEPYISSKEIWTPCSDRMFCGPFIIPENNYFMMGDNRSNSQDSRFWGFLSQDRVIGRANFMFFPIHRINILKDKYITLNKQKTKNGFKKQNYIVNRYEFLYKIWQHDNFYSVIKIRRLWGLAKYLKDNVYKRTRNW